MDRRRFEALDGMRGVAALMIVLVHCNLVLGTQQMLPYGWLSVDLFFVLSGFVIALSYERRLRDGFGFANFMLARARRLLPVHFCAMALLTVVLCAIAAGHGFGPAVTVPAILTEALLNSLFIPDPISPVASAFAGLHSPFPLNPAQWSLWDEWIVNIGYALLLFAMRTRILALAGSLSAAIVLLAVFNVPQGWSVGAHHGDIQMGIFRALAGFTFGVVIFRLYQRGKLQRLPSIRPDLLYLVWISACAIPPFAPKVLYECGVATILAPAIVALLVRSERKMARIYRGMGAVSYPLYASHFAGLVFASAVFNYFSLAPGAWRIVPMIFVALVFAQLVRMLSEVRFSSGTARLAARKAPATTA